MAYKFIINPKMSPKHFLLFLRISAYNLQTKLNRTLRLYYSPLQLFYFSFSIPKSKDQPHTLMATCCPFVARSTSLSLILMELMRPISMKFWVGIQIGVPICQVDNIRASSKKPNKFYALHT